MTDTTTHTSPVEAAQAPQDPAATPESSATEDAPATFSADYVKALRAEAAEHRVKAKAVDEANAALVTAYARADGRLAEASDLAMAADMVGESGIVDPAAVAAAIDALLEAKPHLARIKPPAIPQGVRQEAPAQRSLLALMRERL